jgi:hypothetical protein
MLSHMANCGHVFFSFVPSNTAAASKMTTPSGPVAMDLDVTAVSHSTHKGRPSCHQMLVCVMQLLICFLQQQRAAS